MIITPSEKTESIFRNAASEIENMSNYFCDYNAIMILTYGPAHIVWADDNLEDHHIDFCLKACDTFNDEESPCHRMPAEAIEVVRWSLKELLKIPVEDRYAE